MHVDSRSLLMVPLSRYYLPKFLSLWETIFGRDDKDTYDHFNYLCQASIEPQKYKDGLRSKGVRSINYWLMPLDDEPIALVGLYSRFLDPPHLCWITPLGVHPEYRGQGVGRRVLEWTLLRASVQGATSVNLCVEERGDRQAALRLYYKAQFHTYKTVGSDIYMTRKVP